MAEINDRLLEARSRLARAKLELTRFWRSSGDVVDGSALAKLERDVNLARDDVRTLEAKLDVSFGGIDA